jgi:NADH-quinone oxidoreductase subunit H
VRYCSLAVKVGKNKNEMEIIIIGPVLLSVALITLGERKIMGSIQRRIGPNRVGMIGILQPIVDGLKLVLKETIIIGKSNKYIFMIVPMINIIISLIGYSIIAIPG